MRKIFLILMVCGLWNCSDDNTPSDILSKGLITVPNVENQWTYISLTAKSKVIGQCDVADTVAQRQWSLRTDWDLAICNGMIRTNSGTSGNALGGISVTDVQYDDIDDPTAPSYEQDKDTIEIW